MASNIKFDDNRMAVMRAINDSIQRFLKEASGEVVSETARNSRVDTGQLKASWTYYIEDDTAIIGSGEQNAIWEEFGTGIHAVDINGNPSGKGRQSPWFYTNRHGDLVFTRGKKRNPHGFFFSFNKLRPRLEKRINDILEESLK